MIFCGDLAIPNSLCAEKLIQDMESTNIFSGKDLLINLEGVIQENEEVDSFWKVYNHKSVIGINRICNQLIFSLANNHVYDYPKEIKKTEDALKRAGIGSFGLLQDGEMTPYRFTSDGVEFAVFGHCWEIYTRTNSNKETTDAVVDCNYAQFLKKINEYVKENPEVKVICFMHWNFDFETEPLPAHRLLAHELIDLGVEAVIGTHSHVVQEVEVYRGKVIAYGLGNFYMPDGYYFNGSLSYGKESHSCIAVEISTNEKPVIHYFETDVQGRALLQRGTESLDLTETEAYTRTEHKNVIKKYRIHRKKRRLTPVFITYENTLATRIKTGMVVGKIQLIRFIKKFIDAKK